MTSHLIQSGKYTNMPIYCTVFSHVVISVSRKDLVSTFSINCCSAGLSDWKSQTINVYSKKNYDRGAMEVWAMLSSSFHTYT